MAAQGTRTEARPAAGPAYTTLHEPLRAPPPPEQTPGHRVPALRRPPQLSAFVQHAANVRVELGQSCQRHRNKSSRGQQSARSELARPSCAAGERGRSVPAPGSRSCRSPAHLAHVPHAHTRIISLMHTRGLFPYNNFRHPTPEYLYLIHILMFPFT